METDKRKDFWHAAGVPSDSAKLHAALREGFSYRVYGNLSSISGLSKAEIAKAAVISPATLQRRSKSGRFSRDESDRLYRFAKVLEAAIDLYGGDKNAAVRWLTGPVRGLGGRKPVDMLATSAETEAVLNLIGCLERGIFV